jgi:5-enolpyruvylshikimate-3-phosphate synthase
MKGTISLPPSSDCFFLSMIISLGSKIPAKISPIRDMPIISWWEKAFSGHILFKTTDDTVTIEPISQSSNIVLSYEEIPYRDFSVFLLLGQKKTIVLDPLPKARLEEWNRILNDMGCTLKTINTENNKTAIYLDNTDNFRIKDTVKSIDDVHAILGIALSLKKKVTIATESMFFSPLRHVLPSFGYEINVNTNLKNKNEDPLIRRMRFLQTGKKSDGNLIYYIEADFTNSKASYSEITLCGDDTLGAIFTAAKTIVHKGSLIIENVPLESWGMATLNFFRKMGGIIATQETHKTTFGSCGIVTLEKFGHFGKKIECSPVFLYSSQLPAMVVLSCFASGQSVFRGLSDLRKDEPDGLEQIIFCLKKIGARCGEMPDGIVIDGQKQYDGFDLPEPLPANLAASFAVAGLKCMGQTNINDSSILRHWPRFEEILKSSCIFRE